MNSNYSSTVKVDYDGDLISDAVIPIDTVTLFLNDYFAKKKDLI